MSNLFISVPQVFFAYLSFSSVNNKILRKILQRSYG